MARREHDDWRGEQTAELAADVDTGGVGQAKIEYDELRTLGGRGIESLSAGGGLTDTVGDFTKGVTNRAANLRLVVDDQNARSLVHIWIEYHWPARARRRA